MYTLSVTHFIYIFKGKYSMTHFREADIIHISWAGYKHAGQRHPPLMWISLEVVK